MTEAELSRKQRENLRHKQEILAAAMELFSEHGFHEVSMQQVAERSEFSIGTLYKFFESKDSLFWELMRLSCQGAAGKLLPNLKSDLGEEEKIRRHIRTHKKIIEDQAPSIKLYLSHGHKVALGVHPDIEERGRNPFNEVKDLLVEIIKSGCQKQIFKDINPQVAALSLDAMLEAFAFAAADDPEKFNIDQGLQAIEKTFLEGIL